MRRCIDKAGGLDRYILSEPKTEAQSQVAAELRSLLQVRMPQTTRLHGSNVLPTVFSGGTPASARDSRSSAESSI